MKRMDCLRKKYVLFRRKLFHLFYSDMPTGKLDQEGRMIFLGDIILYGDKELYVLYRGIVAKYEDEFNLYELDSKNLLVIGYFNF